MMEKHVRGAVISRSYTSQPLKGAIGDIGCERNLVHPPPFVGRSSVSQFIVGTNAPRCSGRRAAPAAMALLLDFVLLVNI